MSNFSEKCLQKIEKTQQIYLRSLQKKRDVLRFLDRVRENDEFDEYGLDPLAVAKSFGEGKRYANLVDSLDDCGSFLEFRWYKKSDETKLHHANFCKRDKLCPACSVRRAYKQQLRFMKSLKASPDLLERDWYYIVIPVVHHAHESFETVFERLSRVIRAIVQAGRDKKRGKGRSIWAHFDGAMYSIETTKTQNGWNVHLNLLINAPRAARDGSGFLGGGTDKNPGRPGLELVPVRNSQGQISYQNPQIGEFLQRVADGSIMHFISPLDFSDPEMIRSNLVEILKYSLKFSDLNEADLVEVYSKTYRKRLFGTFGNLRGLDLEGVELDGDEVLDEDFVRIMFARSGLSYELVQVKEETSENSHLKTSEVQQLHKEGPECPTIVQNEPESVIITHHDTDTDTDTNTNTDEETDPMPSDYQIFARTMALPPPVPCYIVLDNGLQLVYLQPTDYQKRLSG